MDPLRELGRMMLVVGIVLVAVGGLLAFGARLPFRPAACPTTSSGMGAAAPFTFPS
jgi:hypothetical protein